MGTTVVITGSTRGIGFGLARCFLERGCNVVINGCSPESTRKAMEQLQGYPEHLSAVSADISSRDDVVRLYDEAVSRFGRVDIWINNAGIGHEMKSAWEVDYGELSRVLRVNIDGAVAGSDSFAYFCRELRDGKSLVDAFRSAYTGHIRDIAELDKIWREYLNES